MNDKFSLKDFWKNYKKELSIFAVVMFIIGNASQFFILNPIFESIKEKHSDKPEIITNIVDISKSSNYFNIDILNGYKVMFNLRESGSTLELYNLSDMSKLNDRYSLFKSTEFPGICEGCHSYSFHGSNIGTALADTVIFDIKSTSNPEVAGSDPKVSIECRGISKSRGCYVNLKDIFPGEIFDFDLDVKADTSLQFEACVANKKYDCELHLIKAKFLLINPEIQEFQTPNFGIIAFPNKNTHKLNHKYLLVLKNDYTYEWIDSGAYSSNYDDTIS